MSSKKPVEYINGFLGGVKQSVNQILEQISQKIEIVPLEAPELKKDKSATPPYQKNNIDSI